MGPTGFTVLPVLARPVPDPYGGRVGAETNPNAAVADLVGRAEALRSNGKPRPSLRACDEHGDIWHDNGTVERCDHQPRTQEEQGAVSDRPEPAAAALPQVAASDTPDNVVPIGVGRHRSAEDRTTLCTPEMGARWLTHIRAQLDALHEKRADDRKRRPAAPAEQPAAKEVSSDGLRAVYAGQDMPRRLNDPTRSSSCAASTSTPRPAADPKILSCVECRGPLYPRRYRTSIGPADIFAHSPAAPPTHPRRRRILRRETGLHCALKSRFVRTVNGIDGWKAEPEVALDVAIPNRRPAGRRRRRYRTDRFARLRDPTVVGDRRPGRGPPGDPPRRRRAAGVRVGHQGPAGMGGAAGVGPARARRQRGHVVDGVLRSDERPAIS